MPYGTVHVLDKEGIFNKIAKLIKDTIKTKETEATIGLTGGSTPKAFYAWSVENKVFKKRILDNAAWMTSDERCVPLSDEESNFGNADQMMLTPLGLSHDSKHPWPVDLEPEEAAKVFNESWNTRFNEKECFDLCFLGMGDDCHTASLFPESPLIRSHETENFAAVEVPGKGWRLTITPTGLTQCKQIVMTVTGKNKAKALKEVLQGSFNPIEKPSQLHKAYGERVTWLVDKEAAAQLTP